MLLERWMMIYQVRDFYYLVGNLRVQHFLMRCETLSGGTSTLKPSVMPVASETCLIMGRANTIYGHPRDMGHPSIMAPRARGLRKAA